jgi:AraC-like DNA-binding protein
MNNLKSDNCILIRTHDNEVEGTITIYHVFPGIDLLFNDFHLERYESRYESKNDIFIIEYCKEGRIEWERKGLYYFLGKGEFYMGMHEKKGGDFLLPTSHYHGFSISINLAELNERKSMILNEFNLDIQKIKDKFCKGSRSTVLQPDSRIVKLVSEIYELDDIKGKNYLKLKMLELLLAIEQFNGVDQIGQSDYFYKNDVRKIKEIKNLLISNYEEHYTLKELSDRYNISLTTMKKCFKGVYGCSVYAYLQMHRMNIAAKLLKDTDIKIEEIAGKVGYENPSKFSSAFKKRMGASPSDYRKTIG